MKRQNKILKDCLLKVVHSTLSFLILIYIKMEAKLNGLFQLFIFMLQFCHRDVKFDGNNKSGLDGTKILKIVKLPSVILNEKMNECI